MDFLAIVGYFSLFFAGFGFSVALRWFIDRRAVALLDSRNGAKGQMVKQEIESDTAAFVAEVIQGFQEAKANNEDLKAAAMRILPAVAVKHPIAVMRLGKKLGKSLLGMANGQAFDLKMLEGFL